MAGTLPCSEASDCAGVGRTKKKGAGGSWRAFVHQRTHGQKGNVNFRALSVQYKAEHARGNREIASLGRRATRTAFLNIAKKGHTAFGPSSKLVQRTCARIARHVFWEVHKGKAPQERADALAVAWQLQRGDLKGTVSLLRVNRALDSKKRRTNEQTDVQVLENFEKGMGQRATERLAAKLPEFCKAFSGVLTPIPLPLGHCVSINIAGHEVATAALSLASATRRTNFACNVEKEWVDLRRLVQPLPCGIIPCQRRNMPCQAAGVCVCSESGKVKWRVHKRLLALIKVQYPLKTGTVMLAEALTVVCMESIVLVDGVQSVTSRIWLHLGLAYFNPWKCTWQRLLPIECPPGECLDVAAQKRQYLKATNEYYTDIRCMMLLESSLTWHVQFYELDVSTRAIPQLATDVVCVNPCKGEAARQQLWRL
eukprot:4310257-Amphidinium_carterae.1